MRLPVVVALVEAVVARALRLVLGTGEMRIVLPELLLRRRDHAVIVLGVLVVIFRCNRIAGGLRVARELNVFFRNVRRISANFHIGPVRFVYARHRIVALAMVVVASAHALVLTVSHDLPVANPFILAACCRRASPKHSTSLSHQQRASICALGPLKQEQNTAPCAAMSASVLRSSNPYRSIPAALPTSSSRACPPCSTDQRRTDEASRPDWANHLPIHPASFVRSVRTVGSPQSCSGARYRRSSISGRFPTPKPSRS